MTKPRRRTQKIHRKRRGSRRGFKSRSQRGGEGWFGESDPNSPKKSWYEQLFGTNNKPQVMPQPMPQPAFNSTPVVNSTPAFNSTPLSQESLIKQTQNEEVFNPIQQQAYNGNGGRKRCKRHHKHSRKCKK